MTTAVQLDIDDAVADANRRGCWTSSVAAAAPATATSSPGGTSPASTSSPSPGTAATGSSRPTPSNTSPRTGTSTTRSTAARRARSTRLNAYNQLDYPDLVAPTRDLLRATGRPWVIENVPQAPLIDPAILCGSMFDLPVYRHRGFESNVPLDPPPHPAHLALCARNGYLPTAERPFMSIHGGRHSIAWQHAACDAMGTPWLKVPAGGDREAAIREVCEAIPPKFTRWIGTRLLAALPALDPARST